MKTNKKSLINFLIPSIIGIIIFMIPVKFDGEWTIIVKIFADFIAKIIGDYLPALCTIIITISFVMSVLASFNVKFIKENKLLDQTFSVTPVWLVLRILGFIVVWMVVLKDKLNLGPFFDMIVADESATFILNDLLTSLVIIFVIASMLLHKNNAPSIFDSWTCRSRLHHKLDWRWNIGCHADCKSIRIWILFCKRSCNYFYEFLCSFHHIQPYRFIPS